MTALLPDSDYFFVVLAMGAVTFLPRWVPILFLSRRRLPLVVIEWLDLIPAAILSALLAPVLFTRGDPRVFSPMQIEVWVALPTFLVAWRFKSLGTTVLVGMFLYWAAEALML